MSDETTTQDEAASPPPSEAPEARTVDPMVALFEEFSYVAIALSPGESPEAVHERVLRDWLGRVYAANPSLKRPT